MYKHSFIPVIVLLFCLVFHHSGFAQSDTITTIKPKDTLIQAKFHKSPEDSIKSLNYNFEDELRKSNPFKFVTSLRPKRLTVALTIEGSLYAATLLGLNNVWYSRYDKTKFHLFDDSGEWQQMDKVAHAMSASTISNFCYYSYRWSGIKHKQAVLYAGAASLAYMTTIEVLDGYSAGWGFSMTDMAANLIGTSFFVSQQLIWQRQYIKMKMSYHPTVFAKLRPEALGGNGLQSILKDYNGLTFWMTMGSAVFVKKSSHFPRWICVSLGYGADGMTGGFKNPDVNEAGTPLPHYDRYRQLYLSMDIDFSVIKTKSKFVKILLLALNAVKIPFPTLEYNTKGQFKFHYLYF